MPKLTGIPRDLKIPAGSGRNKHPFKTQNLAGIPVVAGIPVASSVMMGHNILE
jgi:hypothetical protein